MAVKAIPAACQKVSTRVRESMPRARRPTVSHPGQCSARAVLLTPPVLLTNYYAIATVHKADV